MMAGKKQQGFTLIELLIVVAIIAILAAIAVPNFLEAQVRSKVSRTKADMRTYATAIESYAVDHNMPPPGYASTRNGWGITQNREPYVLEMCLSRLTTPIAYMTSLPIDPFKDNVAVTSVNPGNPGDRQIARGPFFYQDQVLVAKAEGVAPTSDPYRTYIKLHRKGFTWSMHSFGPAATTGSLEVILNGGWTLDREAIGTLYDPTNGTMSVGWIINSNKGFIEGNPSDSDN